MPSFLTASASLPQAMALTAESGAVTMPRAASVHQERVVFPLRMALDVVTAVTKLVVRVAIGEERRQDSLIGPCLECGLRHPGQR